MWTEEVASHAGRYYRINGARLDPKPTQQPHPPILIGSRGRMVKTIGTAAREAIERELGLQVHLALKVRVRRHWRADEHMLDRLGID